jgi:phosphate transport system substrate-binding protein
MGKFRWRLGVAMLIAVCPLIASYSLAEHVGANGARPITDPRLAGYSPSTPASGALTIAGSDTMQPILAKLAIEFRRWHPEVKIAVQGSRNHGESSLTPLIEPLLDGHANSRRGDGKTSGHFGSNQVQLLASSRPLTSEELNMLRERHGFEPTAIPIAQDAIAIYVNRDNPLPGLTLQQADAIFSKSRNRGAVEDFSRWGQLGLSGEWNQAPIRTYGRDMRSKGTRPFFKQVVLLDGEFKDDVKMQPGSASVVLAVTGDRFGVGYSGIGYQSSSVRALPLAEAVGASYVTPSAATVQDGSYPLSRQLYLYVNKAPNKPLDPKILEFLKFANSQEGQTIVAKAGVYPLTAPQITANLERLGIPPLRAASIADRKTVKGDLLVQRSALTSAE